MEYFDVLKKYCVIKNRKIYIIGGKVRDSFLNKEISDIDLVVSSDFKDAANYFVQNIGGKKIEFRDDITRVVSKNMIFDFSPMKGENINDDLRKRDFTINAMAQDIEDGNIIDISNGKEDLKDGIIRCVYDDLFVDDPLRILRAFRFSSQFNFKINEETIYLIKKQHNLLRNVAGERISSELFMILENRNASKYIKMMDEASVLKEIFPYMEDMKTIGKCKYHLVDAFTHSLLSVEFFDRMIEKMYHIKYGYCIKELMEEQMGNVKHSSVLKLAVFLHDIGKIDAMKNENGKVTFKMHEVLGAQKFLDTSGWLSLSNSQETLIKNVISGHMRVLWLFNQQSKNKAIYKFFCDYGDYSIDVILSSLFDVTATRSLLDDNRESELYFEYILNLIDMFYDNKFREKIIDGNDVKKLTNATGKDIGNILNGLNQEIFCGNIRDREEAIEYIKKYRK